MEKYVLKISEAHMPNNCWGRYARIGLCLTTDGAQPTMISDHARNVVRVVRIWDGLHVGSTSRCAFSRARREAEALVDALNKARPKTPRGERGVMRRFYAKNDTR